MKLCIGNEQLARAKLLADHLWNGTFGLVIKGSCLLQDLS